MRNMTEGSIPQHILVMSVPLAVGLIVQTLYYLVDLYFVAHIGDAAIAGVSAAGNATFLVMAFTQILSVGTVALVSHAVGRNDRADASLVFNQSLALAGLMSATTLLGGYGLMHAYMSAVGADAATIAAGTTYLSWFIPGLALQFPIAAMAAALRGTGVVKPTMIVQMLTVLINIVLAPVLIAGWGTGRPMGVAGAGLASTLAIAIGVAVLTAYFLRLEKYVGFDRTQWRPRIGVWRRMLAIGFPAGGELILIFVYMAVIYAIIADFGAAAQAGFGLGSRVMQSIFLPAMAIAFSTPAVAGQNFGAGKSDRVRATFRTAVVMSSIVMAGLTLLCQIAPASLVRVFTTDPAVVAVGAQFLGIISWNFVANGVIFTCSGMFQALGNTWPALLSTATRIATFAVPALWLARQPWFQLHHVWYLSVATIAMQAVLSIALLQWQLRRRLRAGAAPVAA